MSSLLGQDVFNSAPVIKPPPAPLPTNVPPPGALVPLTELDDNHPAIVYLTHRGFDPRELSEVFGVRYCVTGKLCAGIYNTSNTLIFPLWMNGKLIGWQSRLLYTPDKMTDQECEDMGFIKDEDGDFVNPPKYWTSGGITKGRIFFNNDWARQSDVVVVCEGTFDAMAVGKCGVATLGKGIAEHQIRMLMAYWKVVVLLLDPGDADEQMDVLDLPRLHRVMKVVRVDLKGYKDAGEAPRSEIWKQIWDSSAAAEVDLNNYKVVI